MVLSLFLDARWQVSTRFSCGRDPNPQLPVCDPLHEILLTFHRRLLALKAWRLRPWWHVLDNETYPDLPPIPRIALQGSTSLLWSMTVKVPFETPKTRSDNVA